ncbi:MAG: hypothetical protein M1418_06090 [Deltaproteobacteria bacterium]|nr:hypothetical protein [Deltaproteobacteria bacterium]
MTMVSEMSQNGGKVIETILDLLSPERIYREIEYPIDAISGGFQINMDESLTHTVFNRVVSGFVQRIYGEALRLPRRFSTDEALAEGIDLLNRYSAVEGPDRYGSILGLALTGNPDDLKAVLMQLAEIIKDIERRKYVRWVFVCHFRTLEWKRQCCIVATYRERMSPYMTAEVLRLKPEQLVEYFEDLIHPERMVQDLFTQQHYEGGYSYGKP